MQQPGASCVGWMHSGKDCIVRGYADPKMKMQVKTGNAPSQHPVTMRGYKTLQEN